jgi:hypothetical protein
MSGLMFPKPMPHLLAKRQRQADLKAQDARERKACHLRSAGRCEVIEVRFRPEASEIRTKRCARRASQNHHLLGGVGRRNKGVSILAKHRIDTCDKCHLEIEHAVLKPVDLDKQHDAATVRYERIK